MAANVGRLISDYRGLIETCQQRAVELDLSRLEIDRLSGLPSGYAAKLLGSGAGQEPRRMWPVSLGSILGTLGLRLLLIEDEAATARTLALRTPVDHCNQRFGNKCNSKPLLKIESSVKIAAPQRNEPAPMRAHLRVVQGKRRGSKYG
jgi:hypothetical protein